MIDIEKKLEDIAYDTLLICLRMDFANNYLLKRQEITQYEYLKISQEIERSYWTKFDKIKKVLENYRELPE